MPSPLGSPSGSAPRGAVVQQFRPSHGTFLGYAGLAGAAVVVGFLATDDPGVAELRAILIVCLVALGIWMVLLRPRAAAYSDILVLRNALRDTHLPLARVEEAVVRHTLTVWVGEDRYVCTGIGRSTRQLVGQRSGRTGEAEYAAFVESRIEDLARAARRDGGDAPPPVRRTWALPELVACGVLVSALVLSFAL